MGLGKQNTTRIEKEEIMQIYDGGSQTKQMLLLSSSMGLDSPVTEFIQFWFSSVPIH